MKNNNLDWSTVKKTFVPELLDLGLEMTIMHDRDGNLHIATIFRKEKYLQNILESFGWELDGEYRCSERITWVRMEKVIPQDRLREVA